MAFEAATIAASAARTTTGNTGVLTVQASTLVIGIHATASSGTPSVTFTVEWSFDGTNFGVGEGPPTIAAITGVKHTTQVFPVRAPYYRLVWTVTGGTPSLTFSAWAYTY